MGSLLRIYRRHLPHWRQRGATYFVTWRVAQGQRPLTVGERETVATILRCFDGTRFHLLAYVVMDDHVHAIVRPFRDHPLERVVHSWKLYSAHALAARGRSGVWQDEYFDRMLRDERELAETLQYVLDNPSRRWPELTHYPWVWSRPELTQ